MLAMARALMAAPRYLLLDEPSLGLSPKMAAEIFRVVRGLPATGCGVLLVGAERPGRAGRVQPRLHPDQRPHPFFPGSPRTSPATRNCARHSWGRAKKGRPVPPGGRAMRPRVARSSPGREGDPGVAAHAHRGPFPGPGERLVGGGPGQGDGGQPHPPARRPCTAWSRRACWPGGPGAGTAQAPGPGRGGGGVETRGLLESYAAPAARTGHGTRSWRSWSATSPPLPGRTRRATRGLAALNAEFHALLAQAAGSRLLIRLPGGAGGAGGAHFPRVGHGHGGGCWSWRSTGPSWPPCAAATPRPRPGPRRHHVRRGGRHIWSSSPRRVPLPRTGTPRPGACAPYPPGHGGRAAAQGEEEASCARPCVPWRWAQSWPWPWPRPPRRPSPSRSARSSPCPARPRPIGTPTKLVAQMAVDQINKAGGINGRPLELVVAGHRERAHQGGTWPSRSS
jgi:hypothetical protein